MAAATARKAVGMERRACADPKDCKQPELAVGRKKRLQEGAAATAGHGGGGGGHKAQAAAQSASHHRGGGHTGARDWLLVKREQRKKNLGSCGTSSTSLLSSLALADLQSAADAGLLTFCSCFGLPVLEASAPDAAADVAGAAI
jgi:hypothetical protein